MNEPTADPASRTVDQAPPLPDPARLTAHQLQGRVCARCGGAMTVNARIGEVTVHGHPHTLWACGACATPGELAAQAVADRGVTAGYCLVCGAWASDLVVVIRVEGCTTSGYTRYAHRACARERGYKPLG